MNKLILALMLAFAVSAQAQTVDSVVAGDTPNQGRVKWNANDKKLADTVVALKGRVPTGSGTQYTFPIWNTTTSLSSSKLKQVGTHLYIFDDGISALRLYFVDTNDNDSSYLGINAAGQMVFKDMENTETNLSALLAGGGSGDSTFRWSIFGSGTFVVDTMYIQGIAPLVIGRVGNLMSAYIDTTTAGTGIATKYQVGLKEPVITAAASSDYYWNGDKTFVPFASNVRNKVSGQAGQISYNSTTGVISLVAIDTVGTITSGVWQGTYIDTMYGGTGATTIAGARAKLLPNQTSASGKYLRSSGTAGGETWEAVAGSGTVTAVYMSAPTSIFDIDGSPVTTDDTLEITLDTQTANTVFAGPSSGAAATPTFRALTFSDMTSAWWDSLGHYYLNTSALDTGYTWVFDGTEWDAAPSISITVTANSIAQMNATADTLVDAELREDSSDTDEIMYAKNDTVVVGLKVGAGLSVSAAKDSIWATATSGGSADSLKERFVSSAGRDSGFTAYTVLTYDSTDDQYEHIQGFGLDTTGAAGKTANTGKLWLDASTWTVKVGTDGGIPTEPSWNLDSTVLAAYGTNFNRTWFKTGSDSLAVDSLCAVSYGRANGDTVSIRVLWGASRDTPTDSLSDLKCYHAAGGVAAASTKVIPPSRFVWVKITEEDGDAKEIQFAIKGRRKW